MSNEKDDNKNLYNNDPDTNSPTPEIRYIPIDIQAVANDDEIDLIDIFRKLWEGRKMIFLTVVVFAVIGLIVALTGVKEYTSEVSLMPETGQSMSLGALGSLAQQFGFSAGGRPSGDNISVYLYPAVINSNVFMAELMQYEVSVPGMNEEVTLEEYFREYQNSSFINKLLKYTIMLPFTVKNWIFKNEDSVMTTSGRAFTGQDKMKRLTHMPRGDWEILRNINGRIGTSINEETGVFTVSVQMQDPYIAADVADEIVQRLSEYITENRTQKARQELEFIEERFQEAKISFEEAQQQLAKFNDQNRGQLTAMAQTEEQLLQSQYNLNFNLYNSMAQRLEEARISVQEDTPVIKVLEPAAVPDRRSAPRRTFILAVFIILGGLLGTGIVLLRPYYWSFQEKLTGD
ncbi:Wzz/FepE/Etk N-terminal domain-containing protein [Rhodohalobacter sp. 614A]|uniref:Wzz/FepE/Etk N-terminal domain-containing protein n=1 Tax=Rhodohalobacter sp. 614A TaxID=2908649 RepID=UPI001F262439|nr:Wzz/FepE/Etk N-terminal domain-containing protein [Rhodohalobacter sp. 614A]